jgi:hypothetical protein
MPEPIPAAAEPKGPFTSTEVKTFKISGPIEITLTTTYNASHVPPPPSGGESQGRDRFVEALRPLAAIIMTKLDEILANQNPPDEQH